MGRTTICDLECTDCDGEPLLIAILGSPETLERGRHHSSVSVVPRITMRNTAYDATIARQVYLDDPIMNRVVDGKTDAS